LSEYLVTNLNSFKEKLLNIESSQDYWGKWGDFNGEQDGDLSISDIEEEKEDIHSSEGGSSDSGEGDLENEGSSESDHDQSGQNQSDEEENKETGELINLSNAAKANPHLPEMYKRNRRMLKNVAAENRHRTIYKQIEEFSAKKQMKR